MREAPEVGEELTRIREGFVTARTAGLWVSSYPQSQWSDRLGCDVREQTLDSDPALSILVCRRPRTSVHCVGYAVSGPGSVWSR